MNQKSATERSLRWRQNRGGGRWRECGIGRKGLATKTSTVNQKASCRSHLDSKQFLSNRILCTAAWFTSHPMNISFVCHLTTIFHRIRHWGSLVYEGAFEAFLGRLYFVFPFPHRPGRELNKKWQKNYIITRAGSTATSRGQRRHLYALPPRSSDANIPPSIELWTNTDGRAR